MISMVFTLTNLTTSIDHFTLKQCSSSVICTQFYFYDYISDHSELKNVSFLDSSLILALRRTRNMINFLNNADTPRKIPEMLLFCMLIKMLARK